MDEMPVAGVIGGIVVALVFIAIAVGGMWARQQDCGEHEPKNGVPVWCRR